MWCAVVPVLMAVLVGLSSCKEQRTEPSQGFNAYRLPDRINSGEQHLYSFKRQYLGLRLSTPGAVTLRAGAQDPVNTIRTAVVLLFTGTGAADTLAYAEHFSVTDPAQPLLLSAVPADYSLVVIANPTTKILTFCNVGAKWSDFNAPHKLSRNDMLSTQTAEDGAQTLLISLSNEQGPIPVKANQFTAGASERASAAVTVRLTSQFARLIVWGTPTLGYNVSKEASETGSYVITNYSEYAYLLRHLGLLKDGTAEALGDGSDPAERYAVSPYTEELEQATDETALATWLSGNRNTYTSPTPADNPGSLLHTNKIPGTLDGVNLNNVNIYAKETAIPQSRQQQQGLITRLVVLYQLYPTSLKAANPTFTAADGWASYHGYYTTGTALTAYLSAVKAGRTATVPAGFPADFASVAGELARTASIWNGNTLVSFDLQGVKYYRNSYNYFMIPCVHFADVAANAYGHFGVIRNCDYRTQIKAINHFGTPTLNLSALTGSALYREAQSASSALEVVSPTPFDQEVTL